MPTTTTTETARLVTIGRGGHTIYCAPRDNSRNICQTGYATSLERFLAHGADGSILIPAGTPFVISTDAAWEDVADFAIRGPIPSADIGGNQYHRLCKGTADWTPEIECRSFDYVGIDAYVRLVTRYVPGVVVWYSDYDINH